MGDKIRVHVTDDHTLFRCGLKAFIEQESDLAVVGETGSGDETLDALDTTRPDVLLLDINMPGLPAADVVTRALAKRPELGVLILTIHDEEHYLREFLRLGARGYMVKTSTGTALVDAIRKVAAGEQYVDSVMSRYLIQNYIGKKAPSRAGLDLLTGREREVCTYLASGYTNAEVAEALNISKRTVETHRAAIMSKMGLRTRAELVQFALESGLWSRPVRPNAHH
jgi:two-component system response regulator NreC